MNDRQNGRPQIAAGTEIWKLLNPGPGERSDRSQPEPSPDLLACQRLDARRPLSVLTGAGDGKSRIALQLTAATGAERFIQTESYAAMLNGVETPQLLAEGPVVSDLQSRQRETSFGPLLHFSGKTVKGLWGWAR